MTRLNMLNLPFDAVTENLSPIRRAYWRRLLTKCFGERVMGSEYEIITTYSKQYWTVPGDAEEWLKESELSDSVVSESTSDFTPRYLIKNDHWILVIPTPIGNVDIYFESYQGEDSNYKVRVLIPKQLAKLLAPYFLNIDTFMERFMKTKGGVADDDTLGRQLEGHIYANVGEVLIWIATGAAGIYALCYQFFLKG